MVEFTSNMAGNTIIFTYIYGVFAFAVTIYSVYLNIKQAKVNKQMGDLIFEAREIRKLLITLVNKK